MNYEKDILIDHDALDVEWLEQPRMMMKYTRLEAEAEKDYNLAKTELDLVRAKLDKDIRANPDDYEISKITESVVNNAILEEEEFQIAHANLIEVSYTWNVIKGAVRSFHQRKDALENLVRLHGQQYFAGPSVPRNLTKEWEQRQGQKNTDTKIGAKLVRKTKK